MAGLLFDAARGHSASPAGARRPVLVLLLLCLCTFGAGLGRQAITDSDEAYYAEAAREMVESGDWLTPRFNYENRFQKPALYYWLTAATYLVAGATEWAARLWSALSGAGLVLLTWAAARRMTGRDEVAWVAGAIVATCFGCFSEARLALPDLPLTFCITLGIWAALAASVEADGDRRVAGAASGDSREVPRRSSRWWDLAGLAAGLGFLMKGPVALVVPGTVLLPVWWRERRSASLPFTGLARAAAICAVVGLPWYLAMWAEHGTEYLAGFFIGDNLERFATTRFNEPRPVWFYVPIVLGGLMPWSPFLVLHGRSVRDALLGRRRPTPLEWRLLLWAGMPLLFFTLSVGKQPRYVLPVLPPLAILLARSLVSRIDEAGRTGAPAALKAATWIGAAALAVVLLLLVRMRDVFLHASPYATWAAVAAVALAAAALAAVALDGAWRRLPVVAAASGVAVLLGVQFGAAAGVRPEPVETIAALVRAHRTANEPVGAYGVFVRNLVFYTRVPHAPLVDETVRAFVESPGRVLLVAREADVWRLEETTGVAFRELGRARYFNAANIRLRTFLRPDPLEEIETVLLVAAGRGAAP